SGAGRRAGPPDPHLLGGRLRGPDRPGRLLRDQGGGSRHDAADRARAGALRDPLRVDRARHLPHADDGRHASGSAGLARGPGALPGTARPAGGVRADGRERPRDRDAEWHYDPSRWRDPHAAEIIAAHLKASAAHDGGWAVTDADGGALAIEREVMEYDVVVVGAGPAGLACAIRLKQLKPSARVCVLEKASAVGAHSLSGAVLEPGPLERLLPEWSREYPGMKVPATEDEFSILTSRGSWSPVPHFLVRLLPRSIVYSTPFDNRGNYIVSLGQLTAWLATRAETLGVEIFPGFAAAEALFDERGAVKGVRIGDMGLTREGKPGPNFTPGVEIHAPLTVLAEGARGSLSKQLIARYELTRGHCPQTYALGFKELWQLPAGRVRPGRIEHGLGWPADSRTYAGSFLYHLDNDRVYVGYIVGLDYRDPRLKPSEGGRELERVRNFKPAFKKNLWLGLVNSAWETLVRGHSPWTLRNSADWSRLERLDEFVSPERHWVERTLPPRDRVSFVFFAGNAHEESQPVHLKVADTGICASRCAREFGNPCER